MPSWQKVLTSKTGGALQVVSTIGTFLAAANAEAARAAIAAVNLAGDKMTGALGINRGAGAVNATDLHAGAGSYTIDGNVCVRLEPVVASPGNYPRTLWFRPTLTGNTGQNLIAVQVVPELAAGKTCPAMYGVGITHINAAVAGKFVGVWVYNAGGTPATVTYDAIFDGGGNVGIGTDAPTALLHVDGVIKTEDGLVLPKTSGEGIKVDTASPTWPWEDMLGGIVVRGIGANDPDWAVFRDTIRQYRWTNGGMREIWNIFHIPHNYAPGTDLHVHVHWDQAVVDTGGPAGAPGSVKWYFDLSYAKGHGTAGGAADPFNAIVTASVVQQGSTTQYGHMIAEVQITNAGGDASHIDVARIEPDGLLKVRLYRDSGDAADTLDQHPFVGHMDLHFQTTGIGTKQKARPFYT